MSKVIEVLKKNESAQRFLASFTMLVLTVVSLVITYKYLKQEPKKEEPTQVGYQASELPSQFPDYDAIKGKKPDPNIKPATVTNDCPENGCVNEKPATVEYDGESKKYRVTGKFSRAYLYIEALVDYERPLTAWDDFVFRVNGIGGHLIVDDNNLPVPPSETTKYLYDLRSISYYPQITDKQRKINRIDNNNFFSLLRGESLLNVSVYVSSDRPGRVMREVTIYYECLGGSDCKIEELN